MPSRKHNCLRPFWTYFGGKWRIAPRYPASFCWSRKGQVMVCEQEGATWMPFRYFHTAKGNESVNGGKISAEVIWRSDEVGKQLSIVGVCP